MASFPAGVSTGPPSLLSSANLLGVHSIRPYMSLIKLLNTIECILMHLNHFNIHSDEILNWKKAAAVVSAEFVELVYSAKIRTAMQV